MSTVAQRRAKSAAVAEESAQYLLGNYARLPISIISGSGSHVQDAENRRYLDFTMGIAVNTIGHSHPYWVKAVQEQAARLAHVSNLYQIEGQARLAHRLVDRAGPGKVFFCNSGAEANEFLIKLARLWGRRQAGGKEAVKFRILTADNAFHGRTFGGMAATPQAKIQEGFGPMLPGFGHARFNDVDSFAAAIDDTTCAIMLETIQGEGGIHPATTEFLRGIRALCDRHNLLLLVDEVQCGIGRTGRFFAFEHSGIKPDAIGMAKGLGGGFPIGAGWVRASIADLFQPGSHGTTFGGNPLACAAANAVLDVIEMENLLDRVQVQSPAWYTALNALATRHPAIVSGVRGLGYHTAVVVKGDPLPWIARLRDNGLLTVRGGTDGIRLLPPLTASPQELETAAAILDFTFGTAT
jgi:acetylornithine/N-succinyldiaminopimelate aminotransferase